MTALSKTSLSTTNVQICQEEALLLCECVEQTTQLHPHSKPRPQLAELTPSIFRLDSVAIYDADLGEIDWVGQWFDDLKEVLQNVCVFETSSQEPETCLIRRVLRMETSDRPDAAPRRDGGELYYSSGTPPDDCSSSVPVMNSISYASSSVPR